MADKLPHIILASASPRRRQLLEQLGVEHTVYPADIPECPETDESPKAYVNRIAAEKSLIVQERKIQHAAVLAADTEVVIDNEILGKPRDKQHAAMLLSRLSGREHQVLSAVSLRYGSSHWQATSISVVKFRDISKAEIEAYCQTGEPLGKAGAYAVQGIGAIFVRHMEGSYSGIMGLPLFETAGLLENIGLNIFKAQLKD